MRSGHPPYWERRARARVPPSVHDAHPPVGSFCASMRPARTPLPEGRPLEASAAGQAFRDRPPTAREFERLRLALSTFRDGSGMQRVSGSTFPGWRDFERATAACFNGHAPESKAVFDIEIDVLQRKPFGLSLKSSKSNPSDDFVLMELSNSHAKFQAHLESQGLDARIRPDLAGPSLIGLVKSWHAEEAGRIDVDKSAYVVLTHASDWSSYEVLWFDLEIEEPDPNDMDWQYTGKRISGVSSGHRIWDWYGWSGGQLKYYPLKNWAIWNSGPFQLEVPSTEDPAEKARRYWPDLWPG